MKVTILPLQRSSTSMSEPDISEERRAASNVRDALHRLCKKLANGGTATPSELSAWIRKSGKKTSYLFYWMACTAVAKKYQQAEKYDIVTRLWNVRLAVEKQFFANNTSWARQKQLHDAARPLQACFQGRKRIAQHQSRWICADLDIVLCANAAFSAECGITPWACQQPDLRYRWTNNSLTRLNYLTDCWDAYATSELAWANRMIGLSNFPAHPECL